MEYIFKTKGVCPSQIKVEVEGDTISSAQFFGGCNGNGKGICALIKGMKMDDVISRFENITCGSRPTSCPAQLAQALKEIKEQQQNGTSER